MAKFIVVTLIQDSLTRLIPTADIRSVQEGLGYPGSVLHYEDTRTIHNLQIKESPTEVLDLCNK